LISSHQVRVLALLAQKGGVGKTTLAVHLAVLAEQEGRRVLLVDTDPQRSLAAWWRAREAATPALVETTPGELRAVLEAAKADGGIELVVVDSQPSVTPETATVARAADLSLIPVRPSVLDLRAIAATVDVVRATQRAGAIAINAAPPPRAFGAHPVVSEARKGLQAYGLPLAPTVICQRASLAYALIDGSAVTEFEPAGRAAAEMRQLWKFVGDRLWHDQSAPA
jgi:chromosome partitioning protein